MENESCTNIDLVSKAEEALPPLALERFSKLFSIEDYATTLRTFGCDKPITFRTNTLQTNEEQVFAELQQGGMESKPISWCPLGRQLTTGTVRSLQSLPSSLHGGIYIQAASSMLAAHAMQVTNEMRVLDMCAAPGSKTSQLAAIMGNQGMLIANDRSRKRLYRLRDILKTQGVTNVEVLCGQGERLGQSHADCFDRVLVDVPCSGESRFRLDKPIRISQWSMHEIQKLSKLQEQLLIAALRSVVVGGLVVYSTCTFAPEENEFVIDKVLSRNTIDAEVVQIPKHLIPPSARAPITTWDGREVLNDVTSSMRIIPDETTTGFFIACIRRVS